LGLADFTVVETKGLVANSILWHSATRFSACVFVCCFDGSNEQLALKWF
jgi:hypothetical protein